VRRRGHGGWVGASGAQRSEPVPVGVLTDPDTPERTDNERNEEERPEGRSESRGPGRSCGRFWGGLGGYVA
jgi:hypothetical protein